ncbi:MAG: LacI family DNA-binding transcriptional regulator [Pseudolysinimonas sp.]|uniref:LacI family DNA-binding transcriptional regulator n=1 Tax=Pseudolysinimonas sp. TaxID=2680009 RepID=UPI003266BB8E
MKPEASAPSDASPRPTLAAVAARAGVSVSTASLVFSGAGPVATATRERVLAAASELDYGGPDPTARSLRRGRSGVVAVVTEDRLVDAFRDPMNLAFLDGVAQAFGDERAGLLVIPLAAEPETDLAASPMDAAILLGCGLDLTASVDALRRRRIPIVAVEADALEGVIAIDLDNRDASRRGAELLRDLGHRDVAVVTLALDVARIRGVLTPEREAASTSATARQRLAGLREVYPDAGGWSASGSTSGDGYAVGMELLNVPEHRRPTAIVAQSDLLALGVLRAAEELGLQVPGELSILGFDGVRLEDTAPHVLTTLVQPAVEKGEAAAAAVFAALAGEQPTPVLLTCTLRIGTTTGPAPR